MKIISLKVPERYIEYLDKLVETGKYSSRSEAIRAAIFELIRKEFFEKARSSKA